MHWNDVDEIALGLEENYPDDYMPKLPLKDLEELIKSLSEFDDHEIETNQQVLQEILDAWTEIKEDNSDN